MTTTAPQPTSASAIQHSPAHRIVVGMDEHPASVAALRFAATEAAYRGGEVQAVHVWQIPALWGVEGSWPADLQPDSFIHERLQKTADTVQAERARAGEPAVSITVEVVQGNPAVTLSAVAEGCALLVLGTRHHNRLFGSVSLAAAKHPTYPIVLVPPPAEPARR